MAMVRAMNVSGIPQTRTVLYSRLWLRPGIPWTISALAEATSLDRASVREHLSNFPEGHLVRTDEGFSLTPAGDRKAYELTVTFYRAIGQHDRQQLRRFFSTKYAGQFPMRKQAEFIVDLDRCTRRLSHPIALRTVLNAMDLMGPRGTQFSLAEMVNATAYSYQAVHKVMQEMVKSGHVRKSGRTYSVTTKGRLLLVTLFFSTVRRADMRMLRILFEMLLFHNPPLK